MKNFILPLLAATLTTPAFAAQADMSEDAAWSRSTDTITEIRNRTIDPVDVEMVIAQAQTVDGNPDAGSLGFLCLQGDLMVAVSYDDVDMSESMNSLWSRLNLRKKGGFLTIDGEQGDYHPFAQARGEKMFLVQRESDKAKIYNGVLRQSDMSLRINAKDYAIKVAAPNDNFRQFGESCGLGLKARSADSAEE
jgi:hypothetical protein